MEHIMKKALNGLDEMILDPVGSLFTPDVMFSELPIRCVAAQRVSSR